MSKPPEKSGAEPTAAAASAASEPAAKQDVVLVHGVTPDGEGLAVIRKRDDRVELGAVHPLKEGQPIHGEVVQLKPRPECPLVCDVETTLPARAALPAARAATGERPITRKGPAQVATDRYRQNWDAIWQRGDKSKLAN